ncbi:MAG: DUF368 domain-containing protein [Clostridia bacterium]|nr:DUF368 domain-containing protein [Clostridia bacterium]
MQFLLRILEGSLIGLGAVLPGISGGVMCVIFGVYKPLMEVLGNPLKNWKKHLNLLIPIVIGVVVGFLGVSKLLGFLLDRYPGPSVFLFVGLIVGMIPSLLREAGEQGRNKNSFIGMAVAFIIVLAMLICLMFVFDLKIPFNFATCLFCGFCLALSIIAPGMSFSTFLMPLGLYQPFVEGIGNLDFGVLIPVGIGAVVTFILFVRGINYMLKHHYSVMFHSIIGVVLAATILTPFEAELLEVAYQSTGAILVNIAFGIAGIVSGLLLDKFNSRVSKE